MNQNLCWFILSDRLQPWQTVNVKYQDAHLDTPLMHSVIAAQLKGV